MDDLIYGDLENFNEVLDVRKIQDENEDLKSRVEKYALEKQELQKEFDKLTLAFKKLERNYSSLLKTARAEIERKTQMIINLNKEKDKMVLNALSKNKNILNITRNSNSSNYKKEDSDSSIGKKNTETRGAQISNNCQKKDNPIVSSNSSKRSETSRQPSEDTSSYGSNLTNKSATCDHNQAKYCQSYGDSKENIEQTKKKASSIRNRRKSMPTLREAVPELCSEDEYDELKQYPNDKDKYGLDKMAVSTSNRFDRIITDPKQMPETRREAAESRNTHTRPYEKRYKQRDGFEATKRNRRWSPEFSRYPRQHGEDYYRHDKYYNSFGRYDNRKRRRLDSSPEHRSRSGDRRYKHERGHNETRQYQYQDKHPARNKLPSDNEEPLLKRIRTDSSSCQSKEEQRRKDWLPEYANLKEKEDAQYMSCQSPDHLFNENYENSASTHVIREIRNTASTRLDDPRASSSKYSTEIINDQSTLCSVNSKNIELKLLRWHRKDKDNELNKPSLPEMLVNRPENFIGELEKEIFSEVNNIECNRSLESGEISDSETNNLNSFAKNVKNEDKKVSDIPKIGKVVVSGDFLLYKIPKIKSCSGTSLQGEKYSIEDKSVRSKRQPSSINENIRHENDTKDSFDTHEKNTIENSKKNNLEMNLDNSKKSASEGEKLKSLRKSRTKLDKSRTQDDNKKIASSNTLEIGMCNNEIERENCLETIPLKPNSIKTPFAVEDDKLLQQSSLPDEGRSVIEDTNKKPDIFDTGKSLKTKISNNKPHCLESNIVNTKELTTAFSVEYDLILSDESNDTIEKSKKEDTINIQTETKIREQSITNTNGVSNTVESNDSMEAQKPSRKMKGKPQSMKTKLNKLFGDSDNLITPEDLEITSEVEKQQDDNTLFKGVGEVLNLDKNENSEIKRCDTQSEMFAVSEHNDVKNNIGNVTDVPKSKSRKKLPEKSDNSKRKRSRKNCEEKVSSKTKTTGIEKKSKNSNKIREDEEYESKDNVKEIEKTLTENYCNIVMDHSTHIENIEAASTKDSTVVKTVIISTGIQTTSEITSNVTNLKHDNGNSKPIDTYLRQVTRLEALATSTPVKAFENTVSVSQSNNQTSCDDNATDKSSVNSSVDEDIPDVRIFAFRNRRRKIIKKPPPCPPQTN